MKLHLLRFNQFLEEAKGIKNDEKEKIKFYLNKIAIQKAFSLEECKEFKRLAEKVKKGLSEKQKGDFDWITPGLLSFALSLVVDELSPLSR